MAIYEIFECIKNIVNFYFHKILTLTQILIEYTITIMECRALIYYTPQSVDLKKN